MSQEGGAYLACPVCGGDTTVKDSRPWSNNGAIRRRRACLNHNHRFTTVEIVLPEQGALVVIPGAGSAPPQVVTLKSYADKVAKGVADSVRRWLDE